MNQIGVDRLRPPAHRSQSMVTGAKRRFGLVVGVAATVVDNVDRDEVGADLATDNDPLAARMAEGVRRCLLNDAVGRELDLERGTLRPTVASSVVQLQRDRYGSGVWEHRFNCRHQAQVVEHRRVEGGRDAAELCGDGPQRLALAGGVGLMLEAADAAGDLRAVRCLSMSNPK
jgi:hypothetical protein